MYSEYIGSLSEDARSLLQFLNDGQRSGDEIREHFGWSGAKFGAVLFNMKVKATNRGMDFNEDVLASEADGSKKKRYVVSSKLLEEASAFEGLQLV